MVHRYNLPQHLDGRSAPARGHQEELRGHRQGFSNYRFNTNYRPSYSNQHLRTDRHPQEERLPHDRYARRPQLAMDENKTAPVKKIEAPSPSTQFCLDDARRFSNPGVVPTEATYMEFFKWARQHRELFDRFVCDLLKSENPTRDEAESVYYLSASVRCPPLPEDADDLDGWITDADKMRENAAEEEKQRLAAITAEEEDKSRLAAIEADKEKHRIPALVEIEIKKEEKDPRQLPLEVVIARKHEDYIKAGEQARAFLKNRGASASEVKIIPSGASEIHRAYAAPFFCGSGVTPIAKRVTVDGGNGATCQLNVPAGMPNESRQKPRKHFSSLVKVVTGDPAQGMPYDALILREHNGASRVKLVPLGHGYIAATAYPQATKPAAYQQQQVNPAVRAPPRDATPPPVFFWLDQTYAPLPAPPGFFYGPHGELVPMIPPPGFYGLDPNFFRK